MVHNTSSCSMKMMIIDALNIMVRVFIQTGRLVDICIIDAEAIQTVIYFNLMCFSDVAFCSFYCLKQMIRNTFFITEKYICGVMIIFSDQGHSLSLTYIFNQIHSVSI